MSTATSTRLAWPDVAKGVSILGVVILHITLDVPGAQDTWLAHANSVLDPLRIPLFFLISGLFSAKVLNFTFTDLWTKRLWYFFVPYVIFVPVELSIHQVLFIKDYGIEWPGPECYLWHILTGTTAVWFLYALMLFNLVLWVTRTWPAWLSILASMALPVLGIGWYYDLHMIGKIILYLPIFLVGTHFSQYIHRIAQSANRASVILISGLLFVVGFVVIQLWEKVRDEISILWPLPGAETLSGNEIDLFVRLGEHFMSLPFAVVVAVWLAKVPYIGRALQEIGQRTLPIYLGHNLGIALFFNYVRAFILDWEPSRISLSAGDWFHHTWWWMLVAAVGAVLGSYALHCAGKSRYTRWVLYPPPPPQLRW